jgi:ornithine cyclodeaminase/alanine dehydrogenase-like protein (mu-crystallin family)
MPKSTIRVLTAEDIHLCTSISDIIKSVKEAYIQFSSGQAIAPLRTNLPVADHKGRVLYMPAYVPASGMSGVKMVSDYDQNPQKNLPRIHGFIMLMDAETGVPKALIDGEHLTALRTGAASGVATDLLANKTVHSAAVIGAGVQGETQLLAICSVRQFQTIFIIDRDQEKSWNFVDKMQKKVKAKLVPSTHTGVLSEVDVICTATNSKHPVFQDHEIKEGVHINAVGAYLPDMIEVPPKTVKRSKLIVDSRKACLTEPGDIVQPIMSGLIDQNHIHAEIGEIASGKIHGRTSEKEITFFKSVGIAVQDIVAGALIFKVAEKKKLGITIKL